MLLHLFIFPHLFHFPSVFPRFQRSYNPSHLPYCFCIKHKVSCWNSSDLFAKGTVHISHTLLQIPAHTKAAAHNTRRPVPTLSEVPHLPPIIKAIFSALHLSYILFAVFAKHFLHARIFKEEIYLLLCLYFFYPLLLQISLTTKKTHFPLSRNILSLLLPMHFRKLPAALILQEIHLQPAKSP